MTVVRYAPIDDLLRTIMAKSIAQPQSEQVKVLPVEIRENESAYLIFADIAGVTKEDIQVDIYGAQVSITVERKNLNTQPENEHLLFSERSFGKLARSFELKQEVDQTIASAKYVNGVLELTLPKKVVIQATRLAVE